MAEIRLSRIKGSAFKISSYAGPSVILGKINMFDVYVGCVYFQAIFMKGEFTHKSVIQQKNFSLFEFIFQVRVNLFQPYTLQESIRSKVNRPLWDRNPNTYTFNLECP